MDGKSSEKRNATHKNPRTLASAFMQNGGQDAALQYLVDSRAQVCVFLITGVKFEGVVEAFDQYTISITDIKQPQQLIYKDKISTLAVKKGGSAPFSNLALRRRHDSAGED